MSARLARVLLVLALLAGWQAALVHPLQHLGQDGSLVHLSGDTEKQPDKSVLCDVLAALAACAASAALGVHLSVSVASVSVAFQHPWRPAEPPPFLSQGPPARL